MLGADGAQVRPKTWPNLGHRTVRDVRTTSLLRKLFSAEFLGKNPGDRRGPGQAETWPNLGHRSPDLLTAGSSGRR